MEETIGFSIEAGRRHIIERPRLTRLLDQASARVLMLVAPAGYGKTTLAQQWLTGKPHGWYRATVASADVAALALGLADAASAIVPGAANRLRERLRVTQEPEREVEVLAELLAEDLSAWPDDAWLAIDDYQFVSSPPSERFVDLVARHSGIHLLLMARRRPGWATARRLLYGELYEIGQHGLAMTEDEAAAVLAGGRLEAPGLVAAADGWPAVIGLARLAPSIPEKDVPSPLYDFFAEELYAAASGRLRRALPTMLVPPTLDFDVARHLFGKDAARLIQESMAIGFLAPRGENQFEFHPLLRRFFEARLGGATAAISRTADELSRFFIECRRWDEAFSVIVRFGGRELLGNLITQSLDDLLQEGRVTTLAGWIHHVTTMRHQVPIVDLAAAEVAFRQGQYEKAEHLARRAANLLPAENRLRSRMLFRAGHSAHFLDRGKDALRYFTDARAAALTKPDELRAIWGQFIASIELERPDAVTFLADHQKRAEDDIDATLRGADGELVVAIRLRGVRHIIPNARRHLNFLDQVNDPMVRSGFITMFAVALMVAAEYDEALEQLEVAIREVERFRLEFCLPHILVIRAGAQLGRRDFRGASAQLDEVAQMPSSRDEPHVVMNAAALRARLLLAVGRASEAAEITEREWAALPSAVMYGEYLASHALALACCGRSEHALAAADRADQISQQLDSRALTTWTRAVIAVHEERSDVEDVLAASGDFLRETGHADSFVAAYRGFPALANRLRPYVPDVELGGILHRANDFAVAEQLGLHVSDDAGGARLTPREHEVHQLLAQGQTNREIAKALFITEATVKVHVRHIFAKLGARSRTEAAVKEVSRQLR